MIESVSADIAIDQSWRTSRMRVLGPQARLAILCCIVSMLLMGTTANLSAQCSIQAHRTAERYLKDVFEGGTIGGSESAFKDEVQIVMDNGEPPASPVVVTTSYRIVKERPNGEASCTFTVLFKTAGTIGADLRFQRHPITESVSIRLLRTNGDWGIDLSTLRFPPHVGRDGLLAWLKKLRPGYPARVKALEGVVAQL